MFVEADEQRPTTSDSSTATQPVQPEMFAEAPSTRGVAERQANESVDIQPASQPVEDQPLAQPTDELASAQLGPHASASDVASPLEEERVTEPDASLASPRPSSESMAPDGTAWPETPLNRSEPLPRTEDLQVERGDDGLIRSVDEKPVDQFVSEFADQRATRYSELQPSGGEFSRTNVGEVVSVVFDSRTGKLYEGTNGLVTQPERVPDDLHPLLQAPLNDLRAQALAKPEQYIHGRDREGNVVYGRYPHQSVPGTHAEVQALSRALYDREALGMPVSSASLSEMIVDNRFPYGWKSGKEAPCCPNCTAIVGATRSLAGKRSVDEMRR
jgi:hypothetical protein